MKKSLILLGMLSIGYAYSQQGNVGINIENPKATLEIVPNATNLAGTTNEGIIIPKLTKARVVAIAAGSLVEGTKVYVTDEVTSADTQFIGTGKGFYFYNGTKWVKQLDSSNGINTELWTQRTNGNTTDTYLKPANEKTDLVAYLDNGNGVRNWRINFGNVQNTDLVYNNGAEGIGFKMEESIRGNFLSSDAFPKQRVQNGSENFFFNTSQGIIKDTHASGVNKPSYYGNETRIIARNLNTALGTLYGSNSSVDLFSNNTADGIFGGAMTTAVGSVDGFKPTVNNNIGGQMTARNYATSTNMFGGRFYIRNYDTANNLRGIHVGTSTQQAVNGITPAHSVESVRGIQNMVYMEDNGTLKSNLVSSYNALSIGNNTTINNESVIRGVYSRIDTKVTTAPIALSNFMSVFSPVETKVLNYEDYTAYPSFGANSSITNYSAFKVSGGNIDRTASIENMYGLSIADISKGTTSNFAIHTGKGKVRFGELTGSGDRPVYVDSDGVLKVGTTSSSTEASKVASTNGMQCNADNRGKMNFIPNDNGSDIFGICLRNIDGNYYWGYMVGGNNPTNGTGAFGSGL